MKDQLNETLERVGDLKSQLKEREGEVERLGVLVAPFPSC